MSETNAPSMTDDNGRSIEEEFGDEAFENENSSEGEEVLGSGEKQTTEDGFVSKQEFQKFVTDLTGGFANFKSELIANIGSMVGGQVGSLREAFQQPAKEEPEADPYDAILQQFPADDIAGVAVRHLVSDNRAMRQQLQQYGQMAQSAHEKAARLEGEKVVERTTREISDGLTAARVPVHLQKVGSTLVKALALSTNGSVKDVLPSAVKMLLDTEKSILEADRKGRPTTPPPGFGRGRPGVRNPGGDTMDDIGNAFRDDLRKLIGR